MRQYDDNRNPIRSDISVEEFDALTETHEFSVRYRKNKRAMLRKYRKTVCYTNRAGVLKAAAALFVFLTVPVLAAAASGSEFFSRVWGTAGKKNIESHTEEVYDEQKDITYTVTYPKRSYTDDNLEKAGELIGDVVFYEPIVKEIGDSRLTVLASVSDGNAAVVEFTLEREGGVDYLAYSQLGNESKGAWFSEDSPYYFHILEGSENLLIDLEKSTEDKLYCYDYIVMDSVEENGKGLTMEICELSGDETDKEAEVTDTLFIPVQKKVERREYVSQAGGAVSLSPIAMKVDMKAIPGLTGEEAYDPWHVYYAAVQYKDGTGYVVHEHEIEGIHQCGVETENTSYVCGTPDGQLVFVFNRLTDMERVESVTVNETVYVEK